MVHALTWGQLGDRPVLVSGSGGLASGGTVRLWDPERGQELRTLGAPSTVKALAWGQLGDRPVLASGGGDGTVRLWDPERGRKLRTLDGPSEVQALTWGQLGDRPVLASGNIDGTVRLWDPERSQELRTLTGHTGAVRALAWGLLGDRPVLASGNYDSTVRLWDPERSQELRTLTGHTGAVRALAWGQLGDRPVLASGSDDGTVRLWDPERSQELRTLTGHTALVRALAWGQLGDRPVLASGSHDGTVRLWDPERSQELRTLTGHTDWVQALAWGQLGDRPVLASGSDDHTMRLWVPVIELVQDRLPGYRSDDPDDPDQLNRDAEAAALAEMITALSVSPPLAIGLFGDWGEGKTHFLRRIDDHVNKLASVARSDPGDRLTYSAVRQVRFNAWHYAETDLWASLVAELFSQMAAATPADPGKPANRGLEERRQSRLAAEIAARRQLPERLRAAQDRQEALRQEVEKQADRQWTLPLRLDRQDQARLAGLAGDQSERLYQSMRAAASGIGGTARLTWQFCAVAVRRRSFWLGLLLVAAAIVLAVVARGSLGRLLGTVAGLVALLGTAIQTVRSSLAKLKDQAKPVIEQVQQYAETRRRHLQTALDIATAQVNALQAELHELTPTGQMTALVEQRGGRDSPYRAQLGLMTQIREDFEQMARLLAAPANQPSTQSDVDIVGDELPRIDRIVVYIDDLDRCPPDRVVQVLEAVQLLLAVPLFVVVVAVDPRWLLRSLTVHYQELFDAANPVGTSRDGSWGSTPMQYLEKIFQIPFTLPSVDQTGYTIMIDALTASASAPGSDRSAPGSDGGRSGSLPPPAPVPAAGATAASTVQGQPLPLPAAPVVERFDPLALTDAERQLIALLGPPLVTTPRSIKRLVNSYGLLNALRGSQHEHDLKETSHAGTGGTYHPYRAALALLGILIAFPDLSPAFFPGLLRASSGPGQCSWPQFLKRICPEHTAEGWSSELLGTLAAEAEAHRWRMRVSALEKLTTDAAAAGLPLPEPLEAWAEWVVPVGRLSFETGRSVVTLNSQPFQNRPSP